ncbi:hypothetical protein A1O1_04729 [Capronia coronata CBS 617.96]|uniref:Myb-like domain-containing protein n=1 Tax=Capronia coronata CBS 617.96 TaxID=1182541 RepID=W9Y4Q4_9EURO|nr:uncharacterized protein A1O1_04729 [Capronia coronata CBS 617.96]EXJ87802.1 hypothetical protein A1O1_04729 [Capronia coronata CBS 617.96]
MALHIDPSILPSRIGSAKLSEYKGAPPVVHRQSLVRLPYFAHQQLDPSYFPGEIGLPIGGPKEPGEGDGTWDDDDSDAAADAESDADDDLTLDINARPKKRRKGKTVAKEANAADVKHMKMAGGRPAVAKKVTADLDSDDEIIVRMKEARFLEKDIAQALVDQGRTAYNPKTIGTRWRRLKQALQKRQDELLDADMSDWHEGDDDVLVEAVIKADKETKKAIEEAQARKWRIVADRMKTVNPVLNFSHKACRERYDALVNGNAKPTPESHPNPTPEILARIQSRKTKEQKILQDKQKMAPPNERENENIQANGWSSRRRTYF